MPWRLTQFHGTPIYKLSPTNTIIFCFSADGSHSLEKIKFRCQIKDLKTEVIYYVIDANISYNLLFATMESYQHDCTVHFALIRELCGRTRRSVHSDCRKATI